MFSTTLEHIRNAANVPIERPAAICKTTRARASDSHDNENKIAIDEVVEEAADLFVVPFALKKHIKRRCGQRSKRGKDNSKKKKKKKKMMKLKKKKKEEKKKKKKEKKKKKKKKKGKKRKQEEEEEGEGEGGEEEEEEEE